MTTYTDWRWFLILEIYSWLRVLIIQCCVRRLINGVCVCVCVYILFFCGSSIQFRVMASPYGASRSHSLDTTHPGTLPRTSDQPDTETSTWQHTTLTTDKLPCPQKDSSPQSQQANGPDPRLRTRGQWDRLYIYIHMCVCVCVCVCIYIYNFFLWRFNPILGHGLPLRGLAITLIGHATQCVGLV